MAQLFSHASPNCSLTVILQNTVEIGQNKSIFVYPE